MVMKLELRRRAGIFGIVRDAITARGIDGALVEIPAKQRAASTRQDGSYWFCDLRAGKYTLRISAPHIGTQYGVVTVTAVTVVPESSGKPVFDPRASVQLSPTRVTGRVTDASNATPIAGATVRVRGGEARAVTTSAGEYSLAPLRAGAPTLEVSARGYASGTRKLTLTAGQQITADIALSRS